MKYDALLLVAGQGQRMQAGCNKVFLELDGQPVFAYSLSSFFGRHRLPAGRSRGAT